jgi:hypothetical protein
MNPALLRWLVTVFGAVAIAGAVAWRVWGWESGWAICMGSAFIAIKVGWNHWRHPESGSGLVAGSEHLPPDKDVASIRVHGEPLREDAQKRLLHAMRRASRASACGAIARTVPFTIVDHWSGTWEAEAWEERNGKRGFTINRVCYAGTSAEVVAECVGIEKPNQRSLKPE